MTRGTNFKLFDSLYGYMEVGLILVDWIQITCNLDISLIIRWLGVDR